MIPLRSSIRLRLLFASTLVQVFLLTLLIFNSVRLMNEAIDASMNTMVGQNAAMLHSMATTYGELDRYDALQDMLGELLADAEEGLVYVRIGRSDESLLVSAGKADDATLPDSDGDLRLLRIAPRRTLMHMRAPFLLKGNEVGFIQFGVSGATLAQARKAILGQGAMIAAIEIALTLILLSTIGYFLTRNLGRLLEGSRAIAEGRLAHRIEVKGSDELARVSHHFNLMAETLQDHVGELRLTAERLYASEERYALAMRGANDGLWDWNVRSGSIFVSERFREILDLPGNSEHLSNGEMLSCMPASDRGRYREQLVAHLKGYTQQFECEFRVQLRQGGMRWVLIRGIAQRDADGKAFRMVGSVADIQKRKRAEAQLMHDALHDRLTDLPNQVLLQEHLNTSLGRQQRSDSFSFALVMVNLERFHLVNDSFGHAAGDRVLKEIAQRLRKCVRRGDVAARVGADQFALLLDDLDGVGDSLRLTRKLIDELERRIDLGDGRVYFPRVHAGIAVSDVSVNDSETLLRDADNALHEAKRSGDSTLAVFQSSMHARAVDALHLEADLRRAIDQQTLTVAYQPIIDLHTGDICSFEALVRWRHPERGMVAPDEFVPMAEALGLICDLGNQVFSHVCTTLSRWHRKLGTDATPAISINLSALQLGNPRLALTLIERLEHFRLPPSLLRIEVTESILAHEDGPALEVLHTLRRHGIKILIDDFGTGYSALSYLHRIPCDIVKFDGTFVHQIEHDKRLRAIVRRSTELAHDLGMTVIAECIESQAQADILRSLGCDLGQGYLYNRPLSTEQAEALLQPSSPEPAVEEHS